MPFFIRPSPVYVKEEAWHLCSSGCTGNLILHAFSSQSLLAGSTCASPDEAEPHGSSQVSAPAEFTLIPTMVFGELFFCCVRKVFWLLLSLYQVAYGLLCETTRQDGTSLWKMIDHCTVSIAKLVKRTTWCTELAGYFLLNLWGSTGEWLNYWAQSLPGLLPHTLADVFLAQIKVKIKLQQHQLYQLVNELAFAFIPNLVWTSTNFEFFMDRRYFWLKDTSWFKGQLVCWTHNTWLPGALLIADNLIPITD